MQPFYDNNIIVRLFLSIYYSLTVTIRDVPGAISRSVSNTGRTVRLDRTVDIIAGNAQLSPALNRMTLYIKALCSGSEGDEAMKLQ